MYLTKPSPPFALVRRLARALSRPLSRLVGGQHGDNSDEADVAVKPANDYRAAIVRLRPLLQALPTAGLLPGPQGELLLPELALHY